MRLEFTWRIPEKTTTVCLKTRKVIVAHNHAMYIIFVVQDRCWRCTDAIMQMANEAFLQLQLLYFNFNGVCSWGSNYHESALVHVTERHLTDNTSFAKPWAPFISDFRYWAQNVSGLATDFGVWGCEWTICLLCVGLFFEFVFTRQLVCKSGIVKMNSLQIFCLYSCLYTLSKFTYYFSYQICLL